MGMFQSAFNSLLTSTGAAIELGTKLAKAPEMEAEKEQKKAEHARTQKRVETRYKAWQAKQTPLEPDPAVIEQRAQELFLQKEQQAKEIARQHMLAHMQMMRDAKAALHERRKILAEREANK